MNWTFAEVVAVVALLLAVFVGVRYWRMDTEAHYRLKDVTESLRSTTWMLKNSPASPRFEAIEERLSALERLSADLYAKHESHEVEMMMRRAQQYEPGAWPATVRTPRGDRPEVRNVEEKP